MVQVDLNHGFSLNTAPENINNSKLFQKNVCSAYFTSVLDFAAAHCRAPIDLLNSWTVKSAAIPFTFISLRLVHDIKCERFQKYVKHWDGLQSWI